MNRKLLNGVAGASAIFALLATGPATAGDYRQLAAAAGLSPAEAAGMSLDEIAARKFSGEGGGENVQIVATSRGFSAATAVQSSRTARDSGLDAFHVALINRSVSGNDRRHVVPVRAGQPDIAARRQLAASAGISGEQVATMSLDTIAGHKFNRDADEDERATVRE